MKLTLKQAVSTIILVLSLPALVTYVSARHPINVGEDGMLAPTAALLLCDPPEQDASITPNAAVKTTLRRVSIRIDSNIEAPQPLNFHQFNPDQAACLDQSHHCHGCRRAAPGEGARGAPILQSICIVCMTGW